MNKKDHILDVAEILFNARGYNAVGVDLIRDTAKVSKTSMYRHFGSKNKLIAAVLIRRHQRFERELTAFIATAKPELRLYAMLDWHFDWFKKKNFKGCMFIHALAEFKESDKAILKQATTHKTWVKSLIRSTLAPNDVKLEAKTEAIMTLFEGLIMRAEFGALAECKSVYHSATQAIVATDS